MFDPERASSSRRGQRPVALCAVLLFAFSVALVGRMAAAAEDAGRPVQTLAWVFGPGPEKVAQTY